MNGLLDRSEDFEDSEEWDDRLFRVVRLSDYIKRSVVLGALAIVVQVLVVQGSLIDTDDRFSDLITMITIRCVGIGLLFSSCKELTSARVGRSELFVTGVVTCFLLLLGAVFASALIGGLVLHRAISSGDAYFQTIFLHVAVHPFVYSFLVRAFVRLTGHHVPFGTLVLTALYITIGYELLTPWLAMFLREIAPARAEIGNAPVSGFSNAGHFVLASFMIWFGIKSSEADPN